MARCCNCGCRRRGGPRASGVAWRVPCPTFAELAEHRTQVWSSGAARLSRSASVLIAAPWKRASLRPKASRSDLFERWPPITILICWDNNIIRMRATALLSADILIAPHQSGGCNSRSPHAAGSDRSSAMGSARTRTPGDRSVASGTPGTRMVGSLVVVASARQWAERTTMGFVSSSFSNGVGEDDGEVRTGNAMIPGPNYCLARQSDRY